MCMKCHFCEQELPGVKRLCEEADCKDIHFARGFCRKHYLRKFRKSQAGKRKNLTPKPILPYEK